MRRDFTCGPQPEFPDAPRLFEELKKTDPVVRESAAQLAGHDDRAQFLAGVDIFLAGLTR